MKTKNLFLLWSGCYIVCLLLSFIPAPADFVRILFALISLLFFVPGGILLLRGRGRSDRVLLLRLRLISGLSLLLTAVMMLVNLLSITGSEALGKVMYVLLLLVSAPMTISFHWMLSLFLWACLFVATFVKKP